jgi:hypothetical protein
MNTNAYMVAVAFSGNGVPGFLDVHFRHRSHFGTGETFWQKGLEVKPKTAACG